MLQPGFFLYILILFAFFENGDLFLLNFRRPVPSRTSTRLFGIPKLFRWLVDIYPDVVGSVQNRENVYVDNFYLDMNGIIHSCTHSNQDKLIDIDERQMFLRIFEYTEKLYGLIKPSKLMFLAVDGVAPRAKMNQQRSRRYRASKEREELIAQHVASSGSLPQSDSFDSNCITPGTEFMHRLSVAFKSWIQFKLAHDEKWKTGVEVVFSGPDVPGEGEHKIMNRIRHDQTFDKIYKSEKFNHCMYGLDADLIMLGLVTHEPNFFLLREKAFKKTKVNSASPNFSVEDFEVLDLSYLRAMLTEFFTFSGNGSSTSANSSSFAGINLSVPNDPERIIDDFIFM